MRSSSRFPTSIPPPAIRPSSLPPGSQATPARAPVLEEVFVPFPVPRRLIEPAAKFKSTWIVSSQNALRARGLGARYLESIDREHREVLELVIVGSWVPIDVAAAHYRACDRLELSTSEQLEMGRAVARHLERTLLGTALRGARHAGVTLWTLLSRVHRLWDRMFIGGGAAVYKLGPNEARLEFVGCPLASIPYFRTGFRGVLLGTSSPFASRLYLTEIPRPASPEVLAFRCSWVD